MKAGETAAQIKQAAEAEIVDRQSHTVRNLIEDYLDHYVKEKGLRTYKAIKARAEREIVSW